jgi:uncharacterized membrane protein YdjX (TVP38/TMEM64 family)
VKRATRHQVLGIAALGAVVVAGVVFWSPAAAVETLRALAERPLLFAPALLVAYLVRPFLAWPISILSILVGFLLGPVGVPVALAGAVLTCLPPYLLARRAGSGPPEGLLGRAGATGARFFEVTGGARGLAAMRLAPLPADPVSYGAGLSEVRPGAYVLGTALGELPWVTTAVVLGASLETLTVEGVSAGLPLVVGALGIAVLTVAGPLYRAWRARRLRT